MRFIYQEHSLKPGIYKILNTHTNRVYIGQAKEFKARWNGHKRSLITEKHQNKFLLNDFRKCSEELGHDDFLEFHVLEIMEGSSKEERNLKEEEWIAKFWDKQQLCYNFKQKTEAQERSCFSLTPEETLTKRAAKLRGQKRSPEFCEANSKRQKGTKHSKERIEKNRLSHIGQQAWNKGLTGTQAGSNHPMFGKHHTEEAKLKNSQAHKGKIPWNKGLKLTIDPT